MYPVLLDDKVHRIIDSCLTLEQCKVAHRFILLAHDAVVRRIGKSLHPSWLMIRWSVESHMATQLSYLRLKECALGMKEAA